MPTFTIVGGLHWKAAIARKTYALPIHPCAEELLYKLVLDGFDMCFSQDAEPGHSFAAVYEWVNPFCYTLPARAETMPGTSL